MGAIKITGTRPVIDFDHGGYYTTFGSYFGGQSHWTQGGYFNGATSLWYRDDIAKNIVIMSLDGNNAATICRFRFAAAGANPVSALTTAYSIDSSGQMTIPTKLAIGTAAIAGVLNVSSTGEQVRIGRDTTNYFTINEDTSAVATFTAFGAAATKKFAFAAPVTVTGGTLQSSITYGLLVNSAANATTIGSLQVKGSADNYLLFTSSVYDRVGIGTNAPVAKFHIISTGEQQRIGNDASNYFSTTVASTGSTTFALTGTTPTFTFSQGVTFSAGITIADAKNIVLNTTTGTKIGTATSQKLGLWNVTPVVQPTTGVAAAAFVANTSGIVDDSATFGGYTIGQIVAALKSIGALA